MKEITKCVNDECKFKNECLRYVIEASDCEQYYIFQPKLVCERDNYKMRLKLK